MDENLIGYLLDALDPETRREVARSLEADPELRQRLELLRQAVAPLEADRADSEPPLGLVIRTLGRVAEHCCRDLPHAPAPPRSPTVTFRRPFWRRADVLVAASILVVALGLALSWLVNLRDRQGLLACQNNLREFFTGLKTYSDQHDRNFPNVATAARTPRNVAGLVVPMLVSAQALPRGASIRCPGNGAAAPAEWTLEQIQNMTDEEFAQTAGRLACCYAYSLGYRDADGYHGPRFDPEQPNELLPLMSDRPPEDPRAGNSPNHGGRGQNVLYTDGHVSFKTTRSAGFGGDDIFLNRAQKVEAGLDPHDTVLGNSAARP
jgi:prepilin-type processing-associated H-X9-DG protein